MMGWAAALFGGGSAVLVGGCLVGMGLLMWLLFRLTGNSSAGIGGRAPRGVPANPFSGAVTGVDGHAQGRLRIGERAPGGPAGSGSVAP